MASLNEVEVEWLKSEIMPKLIKEKKIKNGLCEKDIDEFHIKNVTVQLIGSEEAFMLTNCYRARLTYEYKGAEDEINFFVKKTPQLPEEMFDAINFKALFNNEILAYEQIIPALENFGKCQLNTAIFYYADLKSNAATVITEDFGSHNWAVANDRFNLSLDHAILSCKYLAQFHAIGFALRATDRTQFEELTRGLMEARYASDVLHPQFTLKMKCGTKRALRSTRQYEKQVPEKFLEKLKERLDKSPQYNKQLVQPKEPFVTLCHGDYLRNNVAYKYDGQKKPIKTMMFDLQTLRVSSPMLDLATFLALSTFTGVRYKHFNEIFGAYCKQLKESYEKIAQQPLPTFLSFEPLLKEYIKFLPYSIAIAGGFLLELVAPQIITSEELLNSDRSDEDIIEDSMSRGGEVVDREIAHQIKELWQFATEHNVDVF